MRPDCCSLFHIPTDPTWPHSFRLRANVPKPKLRTIIFGAKTAKATHNHQKNVPFRTFSANLAARISENNHQAHNTYPAPDHTSPAPHLAVAHHHHTSLSHLAVAPPQHHNHPLTTHCRERPQHCSSTQTNHIPPPQPTILHNMYDSDLPARHPPRDLSNHRCCRLRTGVIRQMRAS